MHYSEPQSTVATGADIGGLLDVGTPLPCTPHESSSTPVSLSSINFIGPIAILAFLNMIVIFGNGLVIVAVFTHSQLRTVTNTFIVSLAVSDLLLGIVVLPFSSANEMLQYWVFGTIWCSAWLAVDVWLCTASILNLCAISLDRYLAISRPFRYPTLMSPSRVRLTVGLVWLLALAICSPPLLGWKTKSSSNATAELVTQLNLNNSGLPLFNTLTDDIETEIGNSSTVFRPDVSGQPTEIIGVPTANSTHNNNYNNAYNNTYNSNTFPCHTESSYPTCRLNSDPGYIIYSAFGSFWIPMLIMVFFYVKIYRTAVGASRALERGVLTSKSGKKSSNISAPEAIRVHRGGGGNHAANEQNKLFRNGSCRMSSADVSSTSSARDDNYGENGTCQLAVGNGSVPRTACTLVYEELPRAGSTERVVRGDREQRASSGISGRQHRRTSRRQVPTALSRLNRETRAAKTVGIIVGCFIFCWAPFFTVYLLGAFCKDCTPKLVFSICFWMGYFNSAINPLIYGLCSKQFRSAFCRLLLCRRFRRRRSQMQVNMLISELHPAVRSSVRSSSIISVT